MTMCKDRLLHTNAYKTWSLHISLYFNDDWI